MPAWSGDPSIFSARLTLLQEEITHCFLIHEENLDSNLLGLSYTRFKLDLFERQHVTSVAFRVRFHDNSIYVCYHPRQDIECPHLLRTYPFATHFG